jgi:iron complex outermembrane receptor protein
MSELYSSSSQSFNDSIDSYRCSLAPNGGDDGRDPSDPTGGGLPPGNPCGTTQYENFQGGNKDLDAEESTSWNVGFVWNPLDDLSLAVDWFDIEVEGEISISTMQALLDDELRQRQAGVDPVPYNQSGKTGERVGSVVRDPGSNEIQVILRPNSNIAKRETDGLDFEGTYSFSAGAVGDFRATAQWTYVNEYEKDEGDGFGLRDPQRVGDSGLDPENRGTIGLNWALGDFGANVLFNYIDDAEIEDENGNVIYSFDDYQTWDASATYTAPWNGTVTIGARNIFDEDPPTDPAWSNPFFSQDLYDVYGRVPYIRYQQDL